MTDSLNHLYLSFSKVDAFDRELLAAHAISTSREYVLAHPEHVPTPAQTRKLYGYLKRRANHEPLAYIIGHREFFGLDFLVTPDTLIPRPETELIVEQALKEIKDRKSNIGQDIHRRCLVIDIGTGSGNIITSIAKNFPDYGSRITSYKFYGTDISEKVLKIARKNADRHGVSKHIEFLRSNLLEAFLNNKTLEQFDSVILLANLPYLSGDIYRSALPDVRHYEPKTALYSPGKGLAHYRKLFRQIRTLTGTVRHSVKFDIFLEISPEQKIFLTPIIRRYLSTAQIAYSKDLAGKWRIVHIRDDG